MSEITDRKRQPKGVPVGGQYAENSHDEASAPLGESAPESPYFNGSHQRIREADKSDRVKVAYDELATAVSSLADDENWNRFLHQATKFRTYSFSNQMLIAIQCPGATKVNSFKRWKELGRSPIAGSKAIMILAPILRKDEDSDSDEKKLVGFHATYVFDVSQTEGEPLAETWEQISEEPPEGYVEDLENAVRAEGFEVSYEDLSREGGRRGYTSFASKRVVIDSSTTPGTQATTLAHELGHIRLGHGDRTEEYHTGHGGKRNTMEVEADSFAYIVSRVNGMETHSKPSSEYIAGWQGGDDKLSSVADRVVKSVRSTIGTGKGWRNLAG